MIAESAKLATTLDDLKAVCIKYGIKESDVPWFLDELLPPMKILLEMP